MVAFRAMELLDSKQNNVPHSPISLISLSFEPPIQVVQNGKREKKMPATVMVGIEK